MKTRRDFIISSGIAVSGMLLIPGCTSPKQEEAAEAVIDIAVKQDVGLQLYTLRDLLATDLRGTLKQVAELGYNQVELFGYEDGTYFGKPAAEVFALLKEFGLSPISAHYLTGIVNKDVIGTVTNGWDKAVEDAASAGQKYMAIGWLFPEERTLDHYKALPEMLTKAGETCKNAGIQLCYHHHDFEFLEEDGIIPMYHLLDNTTPEILKMEMDMYWMTKAGYSPLELFDKYPGRVPLWHVKDMDNTPEQMFTEVGNGIIDFPSIFAQKDKAGLTNFFVEQDVSADPMKSITTSYGNVIEMI
jgi:sugar phosphate isomerase/epimerase